MNIYFHEYFGPFPIAVVLFSHVVLGNNFYLICYLQVRIHDTIYDYKVP